MSSYEQPLKSLSEQVADLDQIIIEMAVSIRRHNLSPFQIAELAKQVGESVADMEFFIFPNEARAVIAAVFEGQDPRPGIADQEWPAVYAETALLAELVSTRMIMGSLVTGAKSPTVSVEEPTGLDRFVGVVNQVFENRSSLN